jgi:hypothetical protein
MTIANKIYEFFAELLLAFLFAGLVSVTVHLVHKSDAGGNDAAFITWSTNTASFVLGALTTLILKKAGITTGNGAPAVAVAGKTGVETKPEEKTS